MEGHRSLDFLLDAVFPPRCVACERGGTWFCDSCLSQTELVLKNVPDESLSGLSAVGYYHDPRLRAVIQGLKYKYATCLLPSIQRLCARSKNERIDPWPWAGESELAIQPVVGSPDRIRKRGFDQAEFIADIFQRDVVPWATRISILERSSPVSSQADLEVGPLREANTANTFRVVGAERCVRPNEVILLVDDVYTTGATMRDAARALRDAGVERVYGFVLALGK